MQKKIDRPILLFLFLIVIHLCATLFFWWSGSHFLLVSSASGNRLIALGRLAGLLAQVAILLEFVFISRIPFFERLRGFDTLLMWHRWVGYTLLTTVLVHPFFLLFGYATSQGLSLSGQLIDFLTTWEDMASAFFGVGIILAVGIVSLPIIRKYFRYEVWHATHLLMYLAVLMLFDHQTKSGDVSRGVASLYWFGMNGVLLGSMVAYRFLWPVILYARHRFVVKEVIQESGDAVSVIISGKRMDEFRFDPGQYIHILFLQNGFLQPHPFSISRPYDGQTLRITMKGLGDFTKQASTLRPGTPVVLEGPFGRFTERASKQKKFLFVAGGIGITPIRALAESLHAKGEDLVLLYGVRTKADRIFAEEFEQLGIRPVYVCSGEEGSGADDVECGYIDEARIRRLAPDVLERDVYVCGPPVMTKSVLSILDTMGVPKSHIHYEKFSY